jgi:hypothetical protein
MLHAATRRARARSKQLPHARARACNVHAQTLLAVWPRPMRRSGRKASVALRAHSELATAAAAHTVRSSCTASIAAERCRLAARTDRGHRQRCREGAVGGRDRGAPGRLVRRAAASLQGAPQRRRWALVARSLHLVQVASWLLRVARAHLLTAAARDCDLAARICAGTVVTTACSPPLGA